MLYQYVDLHCTVFNLIMVQQSFESTVLIFSWLTQIACLPVHIWKLQVIHAKIIFSTFLFICLAFSTFAFCYQLWSFQWLKFLQSCSELSMLFQWFLTQIFLLQEKQHHALIRFHTEFKTIITVHSTYQVNYIVLIKLKKCININVFKYYFNVV